MKIALIQTDTKWASPSDNALQASKLMDEAGQADLYVLPEMWDTGFCTDPEGMRTIDAEQSLSWMRQTAAQKCAAVCGSMATKVPGEDANQAPTWRNRMYFVRPDGSYDTYDKRHLFAHGGEDKAYKEGSKRVVAQWRGWRFMLTVCYDLRFPIWQRYRGDYDAIINVANWPLGRQTAWDVLARARAIENQCYFIGCNRTGQDSDNTYDGHSCIIGPDGQTVAQCAAGKHTATALLRLDELALHRQQFKFLDNRDNK